MSWKFKGQEVTQEDLPEGMEGFIYKITHLPSGKFYIGKKSLTSTRKLKPLKGYKRKRTVVKPSDWEKYYSSNEWIKEQVKEGNQSDFEREILQFCPSKKSLTYYEIAWQFKLDVLTNQNSLNENILGKFYRRDLL